MGQSLCNSGIACESKTTAERFRKNVAVPVSHPVPPVPPVTDPFADPVPPVPACPARSHCAIGIGTRGTGGTPNLGRGMGETVVALKQEEDRGEESDAGGCEGGSIDVPARSSQPVPPSTQSHGSMGPRRHTCTAIVIGYHDPAHAKLTATLQVHQKKLSTVSPSNPTRCTTPNVQDHQLCQKCAPLLANRHWIARRSGCGPGAYIRTNRSGRARRKT